MIGAKAKRWAKVVLDSMVEKTTIATVFGYDGWKSPYTFTVGVHNFRAEGDGFKAFTPLDFSSGSKRGRAFKELDPSEIVGTYTADVALEQLEEDIQVFLDERELLDRRHKRSINK